MRFFRQRWPILVPFGILTLYIVAGQLQDIYISQVAHVDWSEMGNADFGKTPDWVRWPLRVVMLSVVGMGFVYSLRSWADRSLRFISVAYFAGLVWSVYLLIFRTSAPLDIISSYKVIGIFTPGTLMTAGIFFLGASRDNWSGVRRGIGFLILLVGIEILLCAPFVEPGSRDSGRNYMYNSSLAIEFCAFTPLFMGYPARHRILGLISVVATLLAGVLTQTRGVLTFSMIQLLILVWLRRNRVLGSMLNPRFSQRSFFLGVTALLVASAGLVYFLGSAKSASLEALRGRLAEDTRSDQFSKFWSENPPGTLLFGKGFPTENEYSPVGKQGIDNGYAQVLYIGGIPAVALMLLLFAYPSVLLVMQGKDGGDPALVSAGFTIALNYVGSLGMGVAPCFILVCLLSGRSYRVYMNMKEAQRSRRLAPIARSWELDTARVSR